MDLRGFWRMERRGDGIGGLESEEWDRGIELGIPLDVSSSVCTPLDNFLGRYLDARFGGFLARWRGGTL